MSNFSVILAAAGKSSRFGDPFQKKVYKSIHGKPLWMYSAEQFAKRSDVKQLLLVIAEEDRELFNEKFAGHAAILGIQTVLGGAQRGDSVRNALQQVSSDCTMVAIHDAARPCVTNQSIEAVFAKARMTQAAILAVPCSSTLKRVDGQQQIVQTVPRQDLWLAQTPQCFSKQLLIECYESHPNSSAVTDESTLLEECGYPVSVVEDSSMNVKVTSQQDFKFVEMALKSVPQSKPFPF